MFLVFRKYFNIIISTDKYIYFEAIKLNISNFSFKFISLKKYNRIYENIQIKIRYVAL